MKVNNVAIYGLDESIFRSSYAMLKSPPTKSEFKIAVDEIHKYRIAKDYNYPHLKRAISLANAKAGGENQFLSGITVQFDLTFSNKAWVEAERYKYLVFITSMSTMHRISNFDMDSCCNKYILPKTKETIINLQSKYQSIDAIKNPQEKADAYLELLYNLPSGLEITAGMTTNYRCLRNVFQQRCHHKLPDWQEFCNWIRTLPMSNELIIRKEKEIK